MEVFLDKRASPVRAAEMTVVAQELRDSEIKGDPGHPLFANLT